MDNTPKQEARLDVPYRGTISRLFIFRFLWVYVMIWPLFPWAIWIGIVSFLHFWYMLFLGKRHEGFWNRQLRFFRHCTKWQSYFMFLTDQRPKFIED